MNLKTFMLSAAALSAAVAAPAWAIDPAAIAGAGTPRILRISGATATDNTLIRLLALDPADAEVGSRAFCQSGSMDVYLRSSSTGFVINCLATGNTAGIPAGTHLVIIKETAGGSANGVSPVARQNLLQFIDYPGNLATGGVCGAATSTAATNGTQSYENRTCATATQSVTFPSDVGISDIDPSTFVGIGGVTFADAQALTGVTRAVQVLFSPIVSEPLYRRLQAAQGLTQDDLLANMPSLSSGTLRGIFSGNVIDWDQVYVKNATTGNMVQVGDNAGTFPVYLCRRSDLSGTMTSFKIHFLNEGCGKSQGLAGGINAFATPDDPNCGPGSCSWTENSGAGAGQYGDDFVFAAGGSGDVRNCVSYGTIDANSAFGTAAGTARNEYRIGTASTEAIPATTGNSNRYRYIRTDGAEPTLIAAQEGRYSFFTENTLNDRGNVLADAVANSLWAGIKTNIGNRTAVAAANSSFQNAAQVGIVDASGRSDTGVLVAPINTFVPATSVLPVLPIQNNSVRGQTAALGGPVNTQSRRTVGSGNNNCNNTFQVYP